MTKQYKNVNEMIKKLSSDKKFIEEASKEIKNKKIAKFLFTLRCRHNLTQKELADKIGCTQSRISKVENSYDKDISIKDLEDYGKALNLQLEIGYRSKNVNRANLIKYHAFRIKELLNELAELAGKDEAMNISVFKFCDEFGFNIFKMITESVAKLGIAKKILKSKEKIHISDPINDKLNEENYDKNTQPVK